MKRIVLLRAAVLTVGFGLLVVGCGENINKPTITLSTAEQQADALLAQAEQVLPADVRHKLPEKSESGCYHDFDGKFDDRRQPVRSVELFGLPDERRAEVYEAARKFMEAQGFKITEDTDRGLTGTRASDGFDTVLRGTFAAGDYIELTVRAPCVWENGTPPPKR
ncbi:hypothetical protein [Kitasatospora herbaricolor]|uniref:Lipoprotein n=1 Tax=Kitasatospora herbaricolor TaxID=68217 RepID=A0ABZ1WET2_9ACTN|nr:hypothetical protein [Kitasatospora herbaricolor]